MILKFGGPLTLPQATPSACVQMSGSGSLFREGMHRNGHSLRSSSDHLSSLSISSTFRNTEFLRLLVSGEGQPAHFQGREVAAQFSAAE
jgi:hypothetical protein